MQIIKDIEHMRQVNGLSKRELASRAEISEEYYWRIYTGKAPGVAFNVILSLSEAVGIEIHHGIKPETLQIPTKK